MWQKLFEILPQKHPNKAFLILNLVVFVFWWNFPVRHLRGYWFQIWQINFQLSEQKYPNQSFLVSNLKILVFASNFVTRKIRGRCFHILEYFKILAPKLAFLVPNLRIFIVYTKLCNKANWRMLTSNMTIAFQNCSPKRQNKAFLIPNLGVFVFSWNFAVTQIPGYSFQLWQNKFQLSTQKYPN